MPNPMQDIMALSNQQGLNIDALTRQLADSTNKIQALTDQTGASGADYIASIGDNAKAVAESQAIKAQQIQKNQAIIGLDPQVADNEYAKSVAALNLAQQTYDANRKEYDSITTTSLLDDPLGYIFGQLRLPTVANKVNNAVAAISAAQGNIAARQNLLERQNNVVTADTLDADQRALGAKARFDLAKATMDVSKAQIGDLQTLASLATARVSAENTKYDNKIKALQLQIQQSEAAGNRALRERQMADMDALKQARLEELQIRMKSEADYTAKLAAVGQTMGYQTTLTPEIYKTLSKPSQQAIDTMLLYGKFGTDLPDALKTLTNLPGAGTLTETNRGMDQFLKRLQQYTVSATGQMSKAQPGMPGYVPPKERGTVALENLQSEIEQSTSNPQSKVASTSGIWDSNPNPTLVNPLLMQSVSLPNNSLASAFNTVIGLKKSEGPVTAKEAQQAYRIVRDLVAGGKLSPDKAAADIVEYTKLGILKSKETYKNDMFGIATPYDY